MIQYYLMRNVGHCLNLSFVFITYNIHRTSYIELGVEEDLLFGSLKNSEIISLIEWEKLIELLMSCEIVSLIE